MAESKKWDVFISYASEDIGFVRPLASHLEGYGLAVWYDELELKVGGNLSASINHGLANSKFGVVVLSQNFYSVIRSNPSCVSPTRSPEIIAVG